MKTDPDTGRLNELIQLLFDDTLSAPQLLELNALLRESNLARASYRRSSRVHAALIRHRRTQKILPLAKATPRRSRPWILATAACFLLGVFFLPGTRRAPTATLTGSTAAVWAGDGSVAIEESADLLKTPRHLLRGFAEITYRSDVRVILEGPCKFEVTTGSSMKISHGRATVKVPPRQSGFHLDTPAGRITDLGTEFGVAVGSGTEGPVILTEVFDGEIEIPAEKTPRKRLQMGDSLAIVHETGGTRLVSTLGDYRVDLGDSARRLPSRSARAATTGNLALGKPVTSPAHYAMPHGNSFPPETLTDGRLNDTGSPGDWSFWLAPNGTHGEFTVDLLESCRIGRIELQNTRNRTHGDRGLREISVRISEDNVSFREILHTELAWIPQLPAPGVDFPLQSFSVDPVTARYIKVVGLTHYRNPDRPLQNPNEGGGLNEIQIFAP